MEPIIATKPRNPERGFTQTQLVQFSSHGDPYYVKDFFSVSFHNFLLHLILQLLYLLRHIFHSLHGSIRLPILSLCSYGEEWVCFVEGDKN